MGAFCCTLRDDLLAEVRRLSEEGRFDDLLIESTAGSEPLPVAATFDFRDARGVSLPGLVCSNSGRGISTVPQDRKSRPFLSLK